MNSLINHNQQSERSSQREDEQFNHYKLEDEQFDQIQTEIEQ